MNFFYGVSQDFKEFGQSIVKKFSKLHFTKLVMLLPMTVLLQFNLLSCLLNCAS